MDRKEWLKTFKNYKHKMYDCDRKPWKEGYGNLWCSLDFPPHRCMFAKCPLKDRAEGEILNNMKSDRKGVST